MPATFRDLSTIPEDILREMLALLLVDTPRSPNKTAVLQTCSILHDLGLPYLYKIVDLTGYQTESDVVDAWTLLFGHGGILMDRGRIEGLGRNTIELRIGGPRQCTSRLGMQGFRFRPVHLPRCTTLVIHRAFLSFGGLDKAGSLSILLASLPVANFAVHHLHDIPNPPLAQSNSLSLAGRLFGARDRQPWRDLHTVRIEGSLWFDRRGSDERTIFWPPAPMEPRISFSDWSFKVLVFHLSDAADAEPGGWSNRRGLRDLFGLFFWPMGGVDSARWWEGLERIQLEVPPGMEDEFRRRYLAAAGVYARLQARIFPLIVFVDPDGKERKLVE